jgi:RimJ/RimL family protein N-acetyltransferase
MTWDEVFPPAALVVHAGDGLELRYLTDDLLPALAAVAASGVHQPGTNPFAVPWADGTPQQRARSTMQWAWTVRGRLAEEDWTLQLAVVVGGQVVGIQDLRATAFAVRREVSTGSWLGLEHQGRGTGTRMRLAVLSFAFDHLGALGATTGAWADNVASRRVSEKVGYLRDGVDVEDSGGRRREHLRFRLDAERWRGLGHPRVGVDGLTDSLRALLGVT